MKTCVHLGYDNIFLDSPHDQKCFRQKVLEKIKTHVSFRETQNTHVMFNNFFRKSFCLQDNVENYGRVGLATDNIIRMCIACWISKPPHSHARVRAHKERERICNTCCFSMATVLFVHTLPTFYIVISKFGVIFYELNSILSVFVLCVCVYSVAQKERMFFK